MAHSFLEFRKPLLHDKAVISKSSSKASALHKLRNSRCTSRVYKRQRNQRSNCQHPLDHRERREFQENIYFCFIDYTKAFVCVDHNKQKNSSRDGNTRPPYLPPEKPICWSRSNSYNLTWTTDWFRIGEGVSQGCILTPCLFTYMLSTWCEMPGWMNHRLESRLPGEISTTSDKQMIPL